MTASALQYNVPILTSPFDAGKQNSIVPTSSQMSNGWIPNVDNCAAEQQNYLHNSSTSMLFLMQQLGLLLPFNPNPTTGLSLVATPIGGVVSIINQSGGTEFYVARAAMGVGYSDPSLDPTNWALINFNAIATYSNQYSDATGTSDAIIGTFNSVIYPVLQDGLRVSIGIASANLTTTPTLQVILNGSAKTAYPIKKFSPGGIEIPIAIGDLYGTCDFDFDLPNLVWVLRTPPGQNVLPGTVIAWAGATAPQGYLQCPNALTLVNNAAYPALFAAIGTQWGSGVGQFALPFLPAGYAMLQALGLGAIGSPSVGQVISHSHLVPVYIDNGTQGGNTRCTGNTALAGYNASASTGGSANLAAGIAFMLCVKY